MNTLEHKLPKEVYKWLIEYAEIHTLRENNVYAFMPYYFRMIDEEMSLVKTYSLERLPDELRSYLTDNRQKIKTDRETLIEDANKALSELNTKQIKSIVELVKLI